jgi:hypothetical protein
LVTNGETFASEEYLDLRHHVDTPQPTAERGTPYGDPVEISRTSFSSENGPFTGFFWNFRN